MSVPYQFVGLIITIIFKLGSHYDCNPFSRREALDLLIDTSFNGEDVKLDVIPLIGEIDGNWLTRCLTGLLKAFWQLFPVFIPSLIFDCRKPSV